MCIIKFTIIIFQNVTDTFNLLLLLIGEMTNAIQLKRTAKTENGYPCSRAIFLLYTVFRCIKVNIYIIRQKITW